MLGLGSEMWKTISARFGSLLSSGNVWLSYEIKDVGQ